MTEVTDREFTAFVNERGDALLRVAYALAGNQHGAEDLLQNALAKAYARWPRIRGDAEPYVRRILYHDQVSGWRRRSRRAEVPVAHPPERPVTRNDDHDTDLRLLLRDALLALPPRQRAGPSRWTSASGISAPTTAPSPGVATVGRSCCRRPTPASPARSRCHTSRNPSTGGPERRPVVGRPVVP
ncbi:sigma factor [Micromonospora echinospora]